MANVSVPSLSRWLDSYKRWVRSNPGYVQNLDWLLYLTVWNPARTSASTSEVQYEAYHACIGLLSVWHQHLIEEDELPVKKPAAALWMEALEQVCCVSAQVSLMEGLTVRMQSAKLCSTCSSVPSPSLSLSCSL